ncbi:EPIDERMAL PATTERNING FACTOR-like protein 3 [Raphanus sativus]|uniref:Epidermal patterning factor-like protein n=1 Tax=Raphanus sativus TaxID=3726 RepID=A0A6J0LH44_RAPSA|nr:EPIDERMAL PATTERNING FACTOR-like protein 3 [Raphanus sativus]XP_056867170.1 EPIDERMAL PATTERNING FACTOR-like protein 3 [Raphanus sativus]
MRNHQVIFIMRMGEIRKWYVAIMALIQVVSWVCATSRPTASSHVSFHPGILSPQAAEYNSRRPPILKPNEKTEIGEMEKRRIGSKPPNCEKKCYGCEPCEAIQVPSISSVPNLSTHYANYQPEGWRCHCAP